jgi:fluoride ion exporter CrcB/FEX
MKRLTAYAIVFFGAGLVGMMRRAVNFAVPRAPSGDFPWATPIINVTGFIFMALRAGRSTFKSNAAWSWHVRLFVATGGLGPFAAPATLRNL